MGFNHGSVEALVDRGHFYFSRYDPDHPPGGDAFAHGGYVYPNKQPGAVFVGALVYGVLHRLGWTYRDSWDLTAAVVSWLTTGLATALAAVLLFRRVRRWCGDGRWAFGCALVFGACTTVLPYTGTLYHDSLAMVCLFAAYCAMDRRAWLSGLLLGFTPVLSLLPALPLIGLGLYFLAQRRWREVPGFALGFAAGILPLLVYNALLFGHPLHNAAVIAGRWPEAMPRFDPAMIAYLARTYLRLLVWYEPPVLLGMIGVLLLPASLRREQLAVLAVIAAQLGFALSLGTEGPCAYGPRYLLPLVPFACLGLVAFRSVSFRRAASALIVVVALYGAVVNVVGGMYGTMFCDPGRFAFLHYVDAIRHRVFYSFPLLGIEGRDPRGER